MKPARRSKPLPSRAEYPQSTGNWAQHIAVDGLEITIPARAHVSPNIMGLHHNSDYWGSDANVWRPDRWIERVSSTSTSLEDEVIKSPVRGSYVPRSEGPRICPGERFSRVEYVAVIARLAKNHRIEVVTDPTETGTGTSTCPGRDSR